MALLASHYSDKSAAAFAISKFIQSGAAAASFFSSKYIGLHTKLWILALVGLLSSVTFVFVDWALKRDRRRRHEANVRPNNEIWKYKSWMRWVGTIHWCFICASYSELVLNNWRWSNSNDPRIIIPFCYTETDFKFNSRLQRNGATIDNWS